MSRANYSQSEIAEKEKKFTEKSAKVAYTLKEWIHYFWIFGIVVITFLAMKRVVGGVADIIDNAPKMAEIDMLSKGVASVLYDDKGGEIQKIDDSDSAQEYVTIDRIPKGVQQAFIAMEDIRYYEHHGIDVQGIIQELYRVMVVADASKQKSATITQQLIQNQVLNIQPSQTMEDRLDQKITELYLAVSLENNMGKEQILEYYLNTVSFGQNVLGVQAASRMFFKKEIAEVTVSEAVVLAAMVANPTEYNPISSKEKNEKQRKIILKKMLEEGYIKEEEYADALGDDVYLRVQGVMDTQVDVNGKINSYYVDSTIEQVIADLKSQLGYSQTKAYNMVYRGGLRIYTCQNSEMQKICDTVINRSDVYPQASLVLMEQNNGNVKALIGGKGERTANNMVNRATQVKNQPGTLFDIPAVYAPALDTAGMTLGHVEDDTFYVDDNTGEEIRDATVSEKSGLMTIRNAIKQSKAVLAVKVLEKISLQTAKDYLNKFGFSTIVEQREVWENEEKKVYTDLQWPIAQGKMLDGVTNMELTAAYAAIANEGVYRTPKFYTKVLDSHGNVLLGQSSQSKRILKEETAWLLTSALQDTMEGKAYKKSRLSYDELAVAGKAGYTEAKTDSWFLGYTPFYTVGIWSGDDENTSLEKSDDIMILWKEIMQHLHKEKKYQSGEFKKPDNITQVAICTKCGQLAVEGLCDKAKGGNCIRNEYYRRGTEPTKNCNCHVKYLFCKKCGKIAGENTEKKDGEYKVFLKKKEEYETKDSKSTVAKNMTAGMCEGHKKLQD